MIWHIFRKDVKLMWPLAVLVAGLNWTLPGLLLSSGFSVNNPAMNGAAIMLSVGGLIAIALLITITAQQETLADLRQDWLVRPIRRTDLLLAKVLFAALMIQAPIFLGDMAITIAKGFSVPASLSLALQRSLLQLLVVQIPVLAFASLTRNLSQAITGAVALGLVAAVLTNIVTGSLASPVIRTSLEWVPTAVSFALLAVGSLTLVALQYFRRRTATSRVLAGALTCLCLFVPLIPWQSAFAIQKTLSIAPESSRNINVTFDGAGARYRPPAGSPTIEGAMEILRRGDKLQIYLPFRISGLPTESLLQTDHSEARLIIEGHTQTLQADPWTVGRGGSSNDVVQEIYQPVAIPSAVYKSVREQSVRLEIDDWLTIAQIDSSHALPAIDADQRIPGVGRCGTSINDRQTAITFGCIGKPPACLRVLLEYAPTGQRNPGEPLGCGSFAPFVLSPRFPVLVPFSRLLRFRDPTDLATYPVDGSKLRDARVLVQIFRVQDHFVRRIVIPAIQLKDWEPEAG
jgi:hypothetical protein